MFGILKGPQNWTFFRCFFNKVDSKNVVKTIYKKIKNMLKLTRKKRSQRCSAISWQDFEGHFTTRFLRVSFSMFLNFL